MRKANKSGTKNELSEEWKILREKSLQQKKAYRCLEETFFELNKTCKFRKFNKECPGDSWYICKNKDYPFFRGTDQIICTFKLCPLVYV